MNKKILLSKLDSLERRLKELEILGREPFQSWSESVQKVWAASYGIQQAIQIVLDIGTILLTYLKETNVKNDQEIVILMGLMGIIPKEFSDHIKDMPEFRDILIHEYTCPDLKGLYTFLHRLPDFRKFSSHIRVILQEQNDSAKTPC